MATAVTSSIETKPVKAKPKVRVRKTRKRKKKGKNYYFNQGTEKAIIRYNKTDDARLKNIIYNEHIAKFKEGKGKAFSYFSIVAKNYLILNNNKNYKMGKIHSEMKVLDYKRNLMGENTTSETAEKSVLFVDELQRFWDANLSNIFRRDKDIRVADSVLHIFRIKENIENFNKKALYILIREMTGSNTQHITRIINVMKKYNKRLIHEFDKHGMVDVNHTGSLIND